jgi:hypothetical protein
LQVPKTNVLTRALICPFLVLYPLNTRQARCRFFKKSDLNALSTVDLGPKRPFSVGECALWARLTKPRLVAQAVKLILSPKQRAKPAASRTRTCTNAAVCIASGEFPSRF